MKAFIIAAPLLAAFPAAAAGAPVAALYEVRGEADLRGPEGTWEPAPKAAELVRGSAVRTRSGSYADILYADGTIVRVAENSSLEIEDLRLSADERAFSVKALAGKFLFMAARIGRRSSRFSVRTPSAVCAVRGTDFAVLVSSSSSEVGLFEGSLEVTGDGEPEILEPGQQASAAEGAVLVSPRLDRAMQAEKRRYEKLRSYVRKTRARLAAREDFLQEHIGKRAGRLKGFDDRREEKLKRGK